MSFLERLREKPSHIKAQYSFFGAFGVTTIVAVFWVTSLPARFAEVSDAKPQAAERATEEQQDEGSGSRTLSEILESAEGQVGSAVDSLGERERFSTSSSVTGARRERATIQATTSSAGAETGTSSSEMGTSSPQEERPRTVLIATTSSEKSEQESR